MISFGSFSHPGIVKLEADRNSAFPRSLLRALLRARARRQMGEGWEAQWQVRGCYILALGAPSPCLSLSVFLEEIISPQLRSWQLGTVNCYFWSRQDPTSEGRTGCSQVRSTDACFSKELFHPPAVSVAAASYRTFKFGLFPPSFLFSLPCCVHYLLPLPAAVVKSIFLLCFPSFSSQAFETCQHCIASWHYPDQGDTNICLWVHGELLFF